MTTEPIFYNPIPIETLEEKMEKVVSELIQELPEYQDTCMFCRDEAMMFNKSFSQKYVELETLINIIYSYKNLREQIRLSVVK